MGCLWDLFIRALATAAALWVANEFIPGITVTQIFGAALLIVAVNMVLGPILRLVTLPLTIITLGLFSIIINALLLLGAAWIAGKFDLGLTVDGFLPAILGALLIGIINGLLTPLTASR